MVLVTRAYLVRAHVRIFILMYKWIRIQHRVTVRFLDNWVGFRRGRGDYHSPKESM
jgi:hypothetical protein